jgi:hypothetical protein
VVVEGGGGGGGGVVRALTAGREGSFHCDVGCTRDVETHGLQMRWEWENCGNAHNEPENDRRADDLMLQTSAQAQAQQHGQQRL